MKSPRVKLLAASLILGVLLSGITACSDSSALSRIQPEELSPDAQEILAILDHELIFFTYMLEDSAIQSMTLSSWVYADGRWTESVLGMGHVEAHTQERFGLRVTKEQVEWIEFGETGWVKSTIPRTDAFYVPENEMHSRDILSQPTEIKAGQEIPLWIELGTKDKTEGLGVSRTAFHENDCDFGFVITITFSGEKIE